MKYNNEHQHYMLLQPMFGNDGSGFDRGSLFTISPPWMLNQSEEDFTAKPYLSVVSVHDIGTDKAYQPAVYPYGSPIFKLFKKLKNKSNWVLKLCEHDLDWYKPSELEATCRKCKNIFIVKKQSEGAFTCDDYFQEALVYRSQFGSDNLDLLDEMEGKGG